MYIIADSGSTKTQWGYIKNNGDIEFYCTSGINPVYQTKEEILLSLQKELVFPQERVEKVYYYGAGCAFPEKCLEVEKALLELFPDCQVEIQSDLVGAARSLCGNQPGICCILGTGSNSCFYDGEKVLLNVSPLGFILGDEGSGAVMGKKLIADILKGLCPSSLQDLFYKKYNYTYSDLVEKIYRQPFPNRFLAGFTYFLKENLEIPFIRKIVEESFNEFITRNILQYQAYLHYPVSFTGSVAYGFREILEKQLENHKLTTGNFLQSPIQGLVIYHRNKF